MQRPPVVREQIANKINVNQGCQTPARGQNLACSVNFLPPSPVQKEAAVNTRTHAHTRAFPSSWTSLLLLLLRIQDGVEKKRQASLLPARAEPGKVGVVTVGAVQGVKRGLS